MHSNQDLLAIAWDARENAYPWKSGTKVGCAIETTSGRILQGWNVEGLWATSIHAEVNAIARLGDKDLIKKIAVVAKTEFFTPCGACLDWIVQFRKDWKTKVIIQNKRNEIKIYEVRKLCPKYPIQ